MRPILLIAANYMREQRWAIVLLLAWVAGSALLASFGELTPNDAFFFVKQQAVYGVAFSAFLAASAIHNERRSRRNLAVLSKGIGRGQYLAGLVGGVLLAAALYCLFMGAFSSLMFSRIGIPESQLWQLLALLMAACAVAATTAIVFATFLPPLVAIACTGVALGFGVGLAAVGVTGAVLPVFRLMNAITNFNPRAPLAPSWQTLAWGIVQSIVLWLIATWIFARRDIAVAVE